MKQEIDIVVRGRRAVIVQSRKRKERRVQDWWKMQSDGMTEIFDVWIMVVWERGTTWNWWRGVTRSDGRLSDNVECGEYWGMKGWANECGMWTILGKMKDKWMSVECLEYWVRFWCPRMMRETKWWWGGDKRCVCDENLVVLVVVVVARNKETRDNYKVQNSWKMTNNTTSLHIY